MALLACISVVSWPQFMPWQGVVQGALVLLVLWLAYRQGMRVETADTFVFSEDGHWVCPQLQREGQINSNSRATPVLIWLYMQDNFAQRQTCRLVFKDAVSDDDYRRLSRIVNRIHQ